MSISNTLLCSITVSNGWPFFLILGFVFFLGSSLFVQGTGISEPSIVSARAIIYCLFLAARVPAHLDYDRLELHALFSSYALATVQ